MNVVLRENQQELSQRRLEKLHNGQLNGMASSFDIVRVIKSKEYCVAEVCDVYGRDQKSFLESSILKTKEEVTLRIRW